MDNKDRRIVIIGSFSLILALIFCDVFIFEDISSILNGGKEISFSWKTIAILSGTPFLLYMLSCAFYYSITSKTMRLNNDLVKILFIIFLVFSFLGFPISWYVDAKLKREGYVVCDRLSVGAPNKYVKYPKTCR
ncbi:membrane protein [Xenorhabdus beddingii]|uniref:Membrane protein n=1 Tax=Xenorhabdus beddingii TaxID=40578 RepID=A0A1Y2SQ33_9GAMM|nr:DUF1240 domain-containing protein [Xenorhabdus beddingii]OTA21187.1 membrane protein [Xenorhabdus beddingii]